MRCIIGQGNPEAKYTGTRHNIGFFVLDMFAQTQNAQWQHKPRFKANCTEMTLHGEKVLLVKPTTYYNETGESARAVKDFYKLENSDILVIHDELALPFGTLRTRQDGSDAGNNGIKSLNAHLGTDYARLRIGIMNDKRSVMGDVDFVLGTFSTDERAVLGDIAKTALEIIDNFIAGTLAHHTVKTTLNAE